MDSGMSNLVLEKVVGNPSRTPIVVIKNKSTKIQLIEDDIQVKPFIKWAGGKSALLEDIKKFYPSELGKSINKYCEPFVGGGAVLFDVLSNYHLEEVYISDVNRELVNVYKIIKSNVEDLVKILDKFQTEYIPLDTEKRKEYYYDRRKEFNLYIEGKTADKIYGSALFIFLNRTCFNGLYRVNRKGLYNVPIGAYKNPKILDKENLINISRKLKNVKIVCAEYYKSIDFIDENTLVYFDPPYRPLTSTASFTSYSKCEFTDKEQIELAEYFKKASKKGAICILSNSDPKNTDGTDNFFDNLYDDFNINRIQSKRRINSNGSKRGNISELLITNSKETTMIKGGKGGANTTTGLVFEGKTDLATFLGKQKNYHVEKGEYNQSYNVYYKKELVGRILKKHSFYKILEEYDIKWEEVISKKLLPDDSIFVIIKNTMYIIECKFQQVPGSVDEKLQTCDFKKKQYQKLLSRANIDVEYMYLLSEWFKNSKYQDVLDYIISVGCSYYFEYIPLYKIGLPVPD